MKSKIKKYLERAVSHTKPTELAAIHATVLSIIIGIFAAYFLYINSEIRTKQFDVMSKAEEINKIHFISNLYFYNDKDTLLASGPKDMEKVKNLLWELILLSSMPLGENNLPGSKFPDTSPSN